MPACDIRLWTGPECWHPGRVDWLQSSYSGAEVLALVRRALDDSQTPESRVNNSTYTSTALVLLALFAGLGLEEILQACPSPCTITALERCSIAAPGLH